MAYSISRVSPGDKRTMAEIDALLVREGIRRDRNLDYTCAMYDEGRRVVATGSCFGCTLRCLAVSAAHQGEGLLNQVVTHLMEVQLERGCFSTPSSPRRSSSGIWGFTRSPGRTARWSLWKTGGTGSGATCGIWSRPADRAAPPPWS